MRQLSIIREALRRWPSEPTELALQEAIDFVRRSSSLEGGEKWTAQDVRCFGLRMLATHGLEAVSWPAGEWSAMLRQALAPATSSAPGDAVIAESIEPLSSGAALRLGRLVFQRVAAQLEAELAEPRPVKVSRVPARRSLCSQGTTLSSASTSSIPLRGHGVCDVLHAPAGPYLQQPQATPVPLPVAVVAPRRLKASPRRCLRPEPAVQRRDENYVATASVLSSSASGLSLEEEFAQLRRDMAAERAERQALASLVENLLQDRNPPQRRCSAVDGNVLTTPQDWMPTVAQEWGHYRNAVIEEDCQTPDLELQRFDTLRTRTARAELMAFGSRPGPGPSGPPDPPHSTYRAELDISPGAQQVQDKVLEDTRAALENLEKQLTGMSIASPQTTTPPVTTSGSPGFNLEGEAREMDMQPSEEVDFYRHKCLELAAEVQRREEELVELRHALQEATGPSLT